MKKDWMSRKERIEATLSKQARDRMPFWPKLGKQYPAFQKGLFKSSALQEIHSWIGSDPIHFADLAVEKRCAQAKIRLETGGNRQTIIYSTPEGDLVERHAFAENVLEWHPVEYPIKTIEDVKKARYIYENTLYAISENELENHRDLVFKQLTNEFCLTQIGRLSPVMDLCQHKMGVENFVYLLYDYPEEMNELIELMQRDYLRLLKAVLENTLSDYIISIENTSTTFINPELFRKYCVPHLTDYGRLIQQYGKQQILHMCGKLRSLLPDIDGIPACAIEAFSAPTIGDTTIKDGFTQCPSKVIIGGTSATTWLMEEEDIVTIMISGRPGGRTVCF